MDHYASLVFLPALSSTINVYTYTMVKKKVFGIYEVPLISCYVFQKIFRFLVVNIEAYNAFHFLQSILTKLF